MKWENLSKLIDICKDEIASYGHFMASLNCGLNDKMNFYTSKNFSIIQQ
jgi:hypothetical protein